ncbi:uncharacterized protein LOC128186255 [Crassostrea angulata]|uniref:uncharacterized protein LOC128186255 n=1 Tax=Magallana angulata TaxID=2784310 RepID=UPI0022B18857|nr:uncharacterized protein LOC128186255 [Crassostrea angulata]
MEKNNQTQSERRTRRRTVEQVQRDLLKDLVAHVNKSGNLKTIHERHSNLNVFMPSWAKRDGKSPLQSKAPMTQQDSRASLVAVDRGEEIKNDNHGAERDVHRERMRQVLKELLDQQKKVHSEKERKFMEFQKEKERREIVMKELLTFHAQQQVKKYKQQMIGVFEELMTFHALQRTKQISERMRDIFAELMTFHAQQKEQKSKERMMLVFAELLQTNSEKKKLKLLEEEEFVPRKLFLFNISTFKSSDDHPLQEPSYPDLSCPVASSQLAPPQESLDAKAVVDGENDDEEVDKMETQSKKKKKGGLRKRVLRFFGLK